MHHRAFTPFLWQALWLLFCALAVRAEDLVYRGEARDGEGNLLYTETHTVSSTEGRTSRSLTEYRAPDGTLIATLKSDYSRSLEMPTYVFEDLQRDYREGLRWEDGHYEVFRKPVGEEETKTRLASLDGVFSCQGWHYYLVDNLDLLETDKVVLNLVLPSELRPFPFVVRKLSSDQAQVAVELRLDHWLFRHFAPKLRLVYDKNKRRLTEYRGVSNIPNAAGERQVVTLRYTY